MPTGCCCRVSICLSRSPEEGTADCTSEWRGESRTQSRTHMYGQDRNVGLRLGIGSTTVDNFGWAWSERFLLRGLWGGDTPTAVVGPGGEEGAGDGDRCARVQR